MRRIKQFFLTTCGTAATVAAKGGTTKVTAGENPRGHSVLTRLFCLLFFVCHGLAGATGAWAAPYSGTPTTPLQITAGNYTDYGFTADNYSGFVGYYGIGTAEELYGFAAWVNSGSTSINAVLTADIVINENVLNADGTLNGTPTYRWTPIGSYPYKAYVGTLDGNGHTISGLYVNASSKYVGLIGYSNNGTIKNLGVIDSYIEGSSYVGGICGSGGIQTNCYNTGTVSSSGSRVGGICGGGGTQTNCYNTGTVSGSAYVGGICGSSRTAITNCYNTGTVSGSSSDVGGICGSASGSTIINSYNIGEVSSSRGGICPNGTITNCYYLEGCCSGNGGGFSTTAEEFASGKITYQLNGNTSEGNLTWYQTLGNGNDAYPVFDNTHAVVYATQPCTIEFSNTEGAVNPHPSVDEITGYCPVCGQFTVHGALVTENNYSSLNLSADFVGYYAISNTAELYWFANEVNNGNATINAVLTANIVVNENVLNEDGTLNGTPTYSWTPIGTSSFKYAGTFDGNGHTISGLYFSNTTNNAYPNGGSHIGLIGYANDGATIKNVGVVDSYFKGDSYVGGICGYCSNTNTTISNCYNTGTVSGSAYVGGICSVNGTITNCYNMGTVSSSGSRVGGICGNNGSQTNCYNTGMVSGSSNSVGGICGDGGTQNNCYYLADCGSKNTLGVSATADEFASGKITYLLNGGTSEGNLAWYQTIGTDALPVWDNTHGVVYKTLPCPSFSNDANNTHKDHLSMDPTGRCTACGQLIAHGTLVTESNYNNLNLTADFVGYYAISNSVELYWFANEVNSGRTSINAVLTADIVVNENVLNADGTLNGTPTYSWTPIGTGTWGGIFKGTFDGNGHTISGLYFNNTTNSNYPDGGNNVGLIGKANDGATIKNVGVVDSYFKGYSYVGGICGVGGTQTNCYNTGTVSGSSSYVGGICGCSSSSTTTITNCYNTGTVSGSGHVGGICGDHGTQTNCYNTGTVSGSGYVGGICGYYGTQTNCHNTGTITSSSSSWYIGGICGYDGVQTNCYNTGSVTGGGYVGGICSVDGTITNCYNTGTITGTGTRSQDAYYGGICGSSGTQTNCYNTGAVSGRSSYGGICGNYGTQTNCYYLEGCCSRSGGGVSVTAEEFASGKIGYLLNGNNNNAWYQDLYSDEYPLLDNTHNLVSGYIEVADDTYTVVGDMFLAANYEIAAGKTLNAPAGTSLTTTGNAVITNNGTIICNGTLAGNNLAGNGTFITNRLSLCSISNLSESYVYKGSAYTLEDGLSGVAVNTTILGKTFTLDATISPSYTNNRNVGTATISWTNNADENDVLSGQFEITPKTLAISNIKAENKVYDGNTETTVSYTADVFNGDDVTFGTAATFDNKNAGTGKQVTFNYTKSGADAANYAFANESGSTTANIEPRELAISSVSAAGKEYDGNTATTVTIAASNIVSGDVVTFGTAAAFADKNVGTNKTVNFTYTKSGADAANYAFAQANGTAKANITARTLTLSNFVANGKTYDGTTDGAGAAFDDNRVAGDKLEFTYNYSFENKNVGTNKNVNFSNIAISGGADKGNYTLAATTGAAKADITVKTLAISNIKAESKTYDGNTTTTVSYTADVFSGDNVTFGDAAAFDNKNAGNGKTVSFNYTKSGVDAANYAFANATGSTTANIEPRELAISSVSAASKEYDGNTATTVTIAASNIVSGDVVTFGTAAAFADKNVGTNKTVNFTYTKSGADAANYSFAQANGTATAAISARELTLSNFVVADKVYDGTVAGSGSFSDDRVSGDVLEFSYTVEFDDENANTDIDVYFSDIEISGGADKDNYTLLTTSGTGSAKISPVTDEVAVTIAMPTRTVVYSGHEGRYAMPEMPDVFSWNSNLYNLSAVAPADMAEYQATLQNIQQKTDVGEYPLGWNNETFVNVSRNFSNVKFNVTDGKLIITPKTGVVVTITENSGELVYNTEEQSVEGYTYSIDDELGIYSEDDFAFSGNAVATGTTVGTYPMQLSAADFSNTNTNFANVTFNIVDGALTINKAAEAPNKPAATMETRYIVTQLVALPENWKWADEQQALEEGSNVATANYVGADKGNYVIESVDVTITRLECLHNEGNEVLYTLEPTCTHKGYTGNLSCKLCGEIYEMGDSIPALGHDFVETVVAPTCTTDGYTEHLCNRCQHIEYSDTVAATGHKEDVAVFENIVAATCTEAGSQDSVVYCSVCKDELSRTVLEIPATGHKDSVVIENIVRPTLEAAGSYDSVVYCSVCKVELSRKTIDVLASAVAVSKLPNKVEYKQGEALDVKGGKLTATYSDESTAEFEMLAGWVSGFDSEKVGKQILTVKFETVSSTLTTTFDVTVNAKDDDNTAIDEDTAEISIYAYSNIIVVEAAAITGEIAVFDVNGRMVRKTLAAGTRIEIEMPRQGLYIVRVGNQAKRVVIK